MLVFASKSVGKQVVEYLIGRKDPIEQLIIADRKEQDLIRLAKCNNLDHAVYSKQTVNRLIRRGRRYDWLINAWSPHILNNAVLHLARHRVNFHPSLLPRYRGNDQAAWTIINNDVAGVTLLEMNAKIDAAGIWAQKRVPYRFPIKGKDLNARLQKEVVALFKATWPQMMTGKIRPKAQRGPKSFYTRRATNQDRRIKIADFDHPARVIRRIMAHDFSPNTTAQLRHKGEIYQLTLTPLSCRKRKR